ncbi:MAG TPA: hypothetical protein VHF91_10560, partial [Acidimicrobiales bacterium]|nr:hypothetical protein [Acidimicrobiales bacterium]
VAGARVEWRRFDIQPGRSFRHSVCPPGEVTTGVNPSDIHLVSAHATPILLGSGPGGHNTFHLTGDPRSFLWAPTQPDDPTGPPVGWTWSFSNDLGADWPVFVYFVCVPGA